MTLSSGDLSAGRVYICTCDSIYSCFSRLCGDWLRVCMHVCYFARRKKYRNKKKLQIKERWMHKVQQSISARWTERCKNYIQAGIDEECMKKVDRAAAIQLKEKHQETERNCKHEIALCERDVYKQVADASLSDELGALLLPSTSASPIDCSKDLAADIGITGVARVFFDDMIHTEQQKRIKAVKEAQAYRDMAESMRREKRQIINTMNEKIELVRDFWRNNIKEGSSRAGIMVREALLKKCV